MPDYSPFPLEEGVFAMDQQLADFIYAKMINGENAAYKGNKFTALRNRTRKMMLEDLTNTYLRRTNISGSNNSLSNWKSQIIGTLENLSQGSRDFLGQSSASSDKLQQEGRFNDT